MLKTKNTLLKPKRQAMTLHKGKGNFTTGQEECTPFTLQRVALHSGFIYTALALFGITATSCMSTFTISSMVVRYCFPVTSYGCYSTAFSKKIVALQPAWPYVQMKSYSSSVWMELYTYILHACQQYIMYTACYCCS